MPLTKCVVVLQPGRYVSMAVLSTGNKYGIPDDLIFSFPLTINANREWQMVEGLSVNDFAREKLTITTKELEEERETAKSFTSA